MAEWCVLGRRLESGEADEIEIGVEENSMDTRLGHLDPPDFVMAYRALVPDVSEGTVESIEERGELRGWRR